MSKPPDLLYDKIISALNGNFEAASFLFENRDEIVKDFAETKRKIEKKTKDKRKKKNYASISGSITVNSRNRADKYGTEESALTNH